MVEKRPGIGPPPVRDLNQEEEEAITRILEIAGKIINRDVRRELGRAYRPKDPQAGRVYARCSLEVWNRHKSMAGVPLGTDVRDIHDPLILQDMRLNMEKEYHESLSVN